MSDERDARLVLRAEDRATKTFENVSKSVKDLTRTLQEQAAAALKGEGSLEALTGTLREIEALGNDLEKQRSAVRAFERIGESSEKASERVERATKAYDEYKRKLDDAGKSTEAQQRRLASLAASVEKATAAQNAQTQRLDTARDRLTALGLSSENTAKQLDDVLDVFRQLTPAYGQAQRSIDGFAAAQTAAAARAKDAADKERTAAQQASEAAAQAARDQAALDKQRRDAAALGVRLAQQRATEEQRAAASAAETAQQAAGFRQIADQADAAANNLNRFANSGEAATVGLTRLADAVRQIVAPTLSSVQTLDSAIAQIDKSAALATSKQKVRVSQYQDSLNDLTQAQAALVRQAQNIDAFNRQSTVLAKLEVELGQAANRVNELAAELRKAPPNAEELVRQLAAAERELEQVGKRTLAARSSFSDLQTSLKAAGVNTSDLTAELGRLEGAARRSAGVADVLTTKVGGNGRGFLGLKPYELQNLSFQVNDVFTSLASGISPTQTLAQQGGQILQIFPGVISTFLRLLPVLLPVGLAFGAIAANIAKARGEAQAIKGFDNLFTLAGNAAGLSAEQFGKAQIALQDVGVKADDASKALRAFIDAGLNPASLNTFLDTVRQIAKATGEDIPSAAEKYAAAISGGYDQVVALNDVTHALNDTQLDEVQRLFDAGQAQEARTKVADIYQKRAQEIADKSKTEWKQATDDLEKAFSGLNDSLRLGEIAAGIATKGISLVAEVARQTASDIRILTNIVKGFYAAAAAGQGDINPALDLLTGRSGGRDMVTPQSRAFVDRIRSQNARNLPGETRSDGGQAFLRTQQTQLKNAKLLTDQERLRVAETDAANAAAKAGATNAEIALARQNARKIEQAKLDKEAETRGNKAAAAARKAENAAKAAAREAETRQNKINTLTRDLENSFTSFAAKAQDDPFAAIEAKADNAIRNIKAKFAELAKLGVTTVGGRTQDAFVAQVRAAAALETQQARLKQNEEDVNKLLDQRKTVLAGIEDQVKRGALTPAEGIERANAVATDLDAKLAAAAKGAYDFAVSLRTAKFDPKLEASIARFAENLRNATNGSSGVEIGLANLDEAQRRLDVLVARRNEVVKLNEALVQAGLKSPAAAQAAIKDAFDSSRPAILSAADAVQGIIDRLLMLPGISDEVRNKLAGITTQLVGVRAETKPLNEDLVFLRNAAEQALSQSLNDFIVQIGVNVAGAIEGTQSLGKTLEGIGQAALSFAAQFTRAIADAIIQLIALKVAKAAISAVGIGLHSGGIVGRDATFRRRVPSEVFAGAVRYHTGGLVGLRPDEVPAILQKGEEVITADDPRHRSNGGAQAGTGGDVKVIATLDPTEVTRQALNTTPGQRAVIAVLSQNPAQARQALGLD